MASGYDDKPTASGADWGELSDPIAQLAARLGQLKASQVFNRNNPSRNSASDAALDEEMRPLQELLNSLMNKSRGMGQGSSPGSSFSSGGGISGRQEERVIMDTYKDMRESAIRAAQGYMNLQDPHLLGNLGMTSKPKKMA